MLVRSATAADIPAMIHLEQQCATAAHWTEHQYRQAFQSGGVERLVLIAEASEPEDLSSGERTDVVGFLVARHLTPEWELENILVAAAARRNRLGTRLLEALLAAALQANGSAVFLEVRQSNTAARSLYERAGFELTGRRSAYYKDPVEDAVLYRRALAPHPAIVSGG
jgi:ribosomal-protein-alanine N-acetyltransferase